MAYKKTKLAATLVMLCLLAVSQLTWQGDATAAQQGHRPEIVGTTASMGERLGANETPAFVVHFTGDIHGSLAPCG